MFRFAWLLLPSIAIAACSASDTKSTTTTPTVDAAATDTAADVAAPVQGYVADLTFHGGPSDGQQLHIAQLQESVTGFAFGSVHKQYPAVSLSINDHQSLQLKGAAASPLDFQINFGNLVGSATDPLQCGKAADYAFSCKPPAMKVQWKGITYRSECAGLTGTLRVTDWAAKEGGHFAGDFNGTLQGWFSSQNSGDDCADAKVACKNPAITVDVKGTFDFTLPAPDSK